MTNLLERKVRKENPKLWREWLPVLGIGYLFKDSKKGLETAVHRELTRISLLSSIPYSPLIGSFYMTYQLFASCAASFGTLEGITALVS